MHEEDEEEKKEEPKWDASKLEVGNWFSGTKYYTVDTINKDTVICNCKEDGPTEIDKEVLKQLTENANVYDKEEKLPLTKVVKIFKDARSTAFTVCFTCKVDEKQIQEKLSNLSEMEFADAKTTAKNLIIG